MAEEAPGDYLATPRPAPDLHIPSSSCTVDVRIIDTTSRTKSPAAMVYSQRIPGLDQLDLSSYSFLISHIKQDKHVLFDLGMRKDWETFFKPQTVGMLKQWAPTTVEKGVHEILDEDAGQLGITTKSISAIVWSHHHVDHRGDLSVFPPATELIVGPGFRQAHLPGSEDNPQSLMADKEIEGRPLRELENEEFTLKLGRLPAHDFFGDGSFYILSTPGHTVGHLSALARVSTNPTSSSFVFMGGDCAHYPGAFRPTEYLPLPREIPAVPGSRFGIAPCPGAWLEEYVHPTKSATEPFVTTNSFVNERPDDAAHSLSAMEEFDASDDVLVCIAHDTTLLGNVDFYPNKLNDWKRQGRKVPVRWNFCGDFDVRTAKHSS